MAEFLRFSFIAWIMFLGVMAVDIIDTAKHRTEIEKMSIAGLGVMQIAICCVVLIICVLIDMFLICKVVQAVKWLVRKWR